MHYRKAKVEINFYTLKLPKPEFASGLLIILRVISEEYVLNNHLGCIKEDMDMSVLGQTPFMPHTYQHVGIETLNMHRLGLHTEIECCTPHGA